MQNTFDPQELQEHNLNYKPSYAPLFHKKVLRLENFSAENFALFPIISFNRIVVTIALYSLLTLFRYIYLCFLVLFLFLFLLLLFLFLFLFFPCFLLFLPPRPSALYATPLARAVAARPVAAA